VDGPVNVAEGALLQPLREAVVLLVGNVLARFLEKFLSAMQTAGTVQSGVHRRMIVQVLAIVNRSPLDFIDSFVDLVNGFLFLLAKGAAVRALQVGARVAQIRQRVKISRVLALRLGISADKCENEGKKQRGNTNLAMDFVSMGLSLDRCECVLFTPRGLRSQWTTSSTYKNKPVEARKVAARERLCAAAHC
jgi:hypothetical protein